MAVRVEKVKNRIWLKSEYRHRDMCKEIVGHNWSKTNQVWTYPLSMQTCRELRAVFGQELKIGPDLIEWARSEKAREARLYEITISEEAELFLVPELYPDIASAISNRKYQQIGIRWLAEARRAILGDQPGLGKTVQTLASLVENDIKGAICIFAPKTASLTTWPEELEKWLPGEQYFALSPLPTQTRDDCLESIRIWSESPLASEERLWVICNIEMARRLESPMFQIEWSGIIVDESHRALITTVPGGHNQQRKGLGKLRTKSDAMKIALSGTPLRGKLENLWGTLNWLWPDRYKSFWQWVKSRFEVYENGYGIIIGDLKVSDEELFKNELQPLMLRRTKAEVLPQLPPKMYAGRRLEDQVEAAPPGHWLELVGKQRELYDKMAISAEVDLDGGHLSAVGVLAEMTRLKQFASSCGYIDGTEFRPCLPSNKFDWVVNFLRKMGITGDDDDDQFGTDKVIIASQFTSLLNMYARELMKLGIHCHLLTGETHVDNRKRMVQDFQAEGGKRVFILNTKAGGVSVTLDAADDVVILDETWVPDDQEQVEDRAHRTSRMHQVRIHYLRSLGTIEEYIATKLGDMEHAQKNLLDGARGVEFAKILIGSS